jgi:Mrp family chromosome partitioning ATPase
MSLMLNALKRIEAKQASARAAASATVEPAGPIAVAAPEPIDGDCPDFCVSKNGTVPFAATAQEAAACGTLVADHETGYAADAFDAAIELPPDLTSDGASELTAEDIALPGEVSLEAAMSELSDLIAEARLLDRPSAQETDDGARSTGFSRNLADLPETDAYHSEPEDGAGSTGFRQNPEPPTEAATAGSEAADWSCAQEEHECIATAGPSQTWSVPAEVDAASGEPADVFAEPPVIEPVGSDPYAAAAWQILRQLPEGRAQIVLFTSPGDGHGKTITLARLVPHVARSFSGSVLVVDANSRNPDLARWLEVAVTWRLTDVLAGATHWMNAVRPTALPRVSLLPGGTETSRRSNAQAAASLLRELAGHYDLVLVDASSLAQAGAAQLAASCDGTCLVVRLGEGTRRVVREAVRVVNRAGGRLLGCIAIDAGA